jgi:hypothetical protein
MLVSMWVHFTPSESYWESVDSPWSDYVYVVHIKYTVRNEELSTSPLNAQRQPPTPDTTMESPVEESSRKYRGSEVKN